jgi:oligosaccharide translocation protein RFT1
VSLLGLIFVTFGVQYVPVLLAVLPGKKWSSPVAVATLQWYCAYVLMLGVNGSLEAFVFATANQSEVAQLTRAHVACSLLFASLCFPAMNCLGTAGIVAANCATMMARSAYSGHVVHNFFQTRKENVFQWRSVLPTMSVSVAFVVATLITAASESARSAGRYSGNHNGDGSGLLRGAAVHVAVGASAFLVVAGLTMQSERKAVADLMRLARGDKAKAE